MNKMTLLTFTVAFWLSISYSNSVLAGTDTCGGYTSKGNPFPCCSGKGYNNANCTWWAWKKAKEQWGEAPVSSGNGGTWAGRQGKKFAVSNEPRSPSVVEFDSHVAWVEKVFNECDKKGKNCIKKITGQPNRTQGHA